MLLIKEVNLRIIISAIFALAFLATLTFAELDIAIDNHRLDYFFNHKDAAVISVSADSAGSYTVFWQELRSDGYGYFLGRRFTASGVPVGGEVVLAKRLSESFIPFKFASSGRGNYLLAIMNANRTAQFQRYHYNLTPFDSLPIQLKWLPSCVAIDADYHSIVALTTRNIYSGNDTALIYLYNRVSRADSIIYTGNYQGSSGFAIPEAVSMHDLKKATIFFDHGKFEDYGGTYTVRSRTLSYDANSLQWISSFQTYFQNEMQNRAEILGSAGRNSSPYAYCMFADTRLVTPGDPVHRVTVGSDGEKISGSTIVNTWSTKDVWVGGGFGSKHSVVFRRGADSLYCCTYDYSFSSIPSFFGLGSLAASSIDYSGKIYIGADNQRSVYFSLIGSDTLKNIRINSFDADPVISSSAVVNKSSNWIVLFSALKYRNCDSVIITAAERGSYIRGTVTTVFDVTPAYGGYAYPNLVTDSLKLALVMIKPESSTDTSVLLHLWRVQGGSKLTSRNVSDNGVKAAKPQVAFSGNRIGVVWEDKRASRGDTAYVYLQLFDTLGNAVGGNIALSPGSEPKIAKTASGRFLVTFTYRTTSVTNVGGIPVIRVNSNVNVCVVNSNGTMQVQPFRYAEEQNNTWGGYVTASFDNGNTFIFWLQGGMGKSVLYGRQITSGGSFTGNTTRFGLIDSAVTDYSVALLGSAGAVVSWHDGNNADIRCQIVNSANSVSDVSTAVNNRKINSDIPVSLSVSASDSSFGITWVNGRYYDRTKHNAVGSMYRIKQNNVSAEMDSESIPSSFASLQAFPNPFNASVTIRLNKRAKKDGEALRIYNMQGKLIKSFADMAREIIWDGRDAKNNFVPTGVYTIVYGYYRLKILMLK